jgi:hypothetical protein
MITGGSVQTGINDVYNKLPTPKDPSRVTHRVFPAQVLKVCMSTTDTEMYKFPRDIGAIKFRSLAWVSNKSEDEVTSTAYPLDRSIARYPLPGEEVIIIVATGDVSGAKDNTILKDTYFYTFAVSALHNITSNTHPFMKTESKKVSRTNKDVSKDEAALRFDKEIKDINLIKTADNSSKVYKQLQPFEGDFILQGRFGNSIRFGSTSPKSSTPWADKPTSPGVSGDGILILRVDRDYSTKSEDMFVKEDIDKDDGTIMMCTSQKVPMTLGCSIEMKSWQARYNIKGSSKADEGSNLTKAKDTSQLWQKPIITTQPTNTQYKID